MKLKVCGMRDSSNISELVLEKPDYMGFIFYPKSPRFVNEIPDGIIKNLLDNEINPVAVFVDESPENILNIAEAYGFEYVQLHGKEKPETCSLLRDRGLKVIKSISVSDSVDLKSCEIYEGFCDFFLFDTKTELHGGSGKSFDWSLLSDYKGHTPFFLSGGIGPDDIDAIKNFSNKYLTGIDINSRFETSPALKDILKIRKFKNMLLMKNRINKLFNEKKSGILSIYFTAGFPNPEDTMPVLKELQSAGVDMVEIGIPFSDPMADGLVIQKSSHEALKNGMTLHKLFGQIKNMREEIKIPVILMGYLNVVMQYGLEAFCRDCKDCGVDGVILPDLPMKDYLEEYKPVMDKFDLAMILLVTPETSDDRIRAIDENTSSFIYMVSSASVTGSQKDFNETKQAYFRRINSMNLKNPRLIGFGISNKATLDAAFENASGAIIGSKFIECLAKESTVKKAVSELMESLK